VSAFDVPSSLRGIRTLFTAFHHFRPGDAVRILADARAKRQAVAIFEPFERSIKMALLLGLLGPPIMLYRTPKVGPMSIGRFALTFLLPLAPAIAAWDGFVSSLRSYSVAELQEMAAAAGSDGFAWDTGRVTYDTEYGPMALTYLVGVPS
jgi:hypothetical protein